MPTVFTPSGFAPLPDVNQGHANYGNYQYLDGSIMCWIPKFYYKIGTGSNGLSVNAVDIKELHSSRIQLLLCRRVLHRVIDGGVEQPGFFIDKYM